ncbi:unnamed protein product [Closterium sp. NIES-65]|nr:unnamed protein product [Closterium sp. NIES-65]
MSSPNRFAGIPPLPTHDLLSAHLVPSPLPTYPSEPLQRSIIPPSLPPPHPNLYQPSYSLAANVPLSLSTSSPLSLPTTPIRPNPLSPLCLHALPHPCLASLKPLCHPTPASPDSRPCQPPFLPIHWGWWLPKEAAACRTVAPPPPSLCQRPFPRLPPPVLLHLLSLYRCDTRFQLSKNVPARGLTARHTGRGSHPIRPFLLTPCRRYLPPSRRSPSHSPYPLPHSPPSPIPPTPPSPLPPTSQSLRPTPPSPLPYLPTVASPSSTPSPLPPPRRRLSLLRAVASPSSAASPLPPLRSRLSLLRAVASPSSPPSPSLLPAVASPSSPPSPSLLPAVAPGVQARIGAQAQIGAQSRVGA